MENFVLAEFRKQSLPDQRKIMAAWSSSAPVVSIVCTTYNHAAYLEDAIRGFLLQKTDFPFEIIFHDDMSTDDTREIINRYASEYPALIRTVFQKENQYSKGIKILLLAVGYASGQYIAFCEGDDFWISPDKLQVQVDAISNLPDCEMCFHSAVVLKGEEPAKKLFCRRAKGNRLFGVEPIIRCGGSFMPTASMLIRRVFFDRARQDDTGFFKKYLMGYFCQIFCSLAGGALYIDRSMSIYRSLSEGSWTQTLSRNVEFYKQWLTTYLVSLRAANARTAYKYSKAFSVPIRRCHLSVLNNNNLDLAFRRDYFSENRREIGLAGEILWFCVARLPVLHAIAMWFRSLVRQNFRSI